MQLAAVGVLCAHFRFELAERMGGPEGVGNSSINRLTLQPKVSCGVGTHPVCPFMALMPTAHSPCNVPLCTCHWAMRCCKHIYTAQHRRSLQPSPAGQVMSLILSSYYVYCSGSLMQLSEIWMGLVTGRNVDAELSPREQ